MPVLTDDNVRSAPCKIGPLQCRPLPARAGSPVGGGIGHGRTVHLEVPDAAGHALLREGLRL